MGKIHCILLVTALLVASVHSACPSATYVDPYGTPTYPAAPTTIVPSQATPSTYDPLTSGHWSETANLAAHRPPIAYSVYDATSCPHLQTGLKNWHDPATWGTAVPANGANVVLPANTAVLVASCSVDPSWVFGSITIPSTSKLIFGNADIAFQAKGFVVQGSLLVGSETCRISKKVSITLVGSRTAQTLPAPAPVKGIHVTGTLDLHGAKYSPTWTRLAMTAKAGATVIYIQDVPNWQVGQRIVVTSTEHKDARDWHRNEERSIAAIYKTTLAGGTVAAIQLDSALLYTHFGGREYQAEVALLSRNVVVQGDAASLPTDTSKVACTYGKQNSTYPCEDTYLTGFGGHIIIDGSLFTKPTGRLSGVELFRVGQTNLVGRYPIHFHMLGDVTNSNYAKHFVQDSSVHDSFFRCYAIHGTQGVKLTENTAYNAIGHCYFLEDGVEENNTISYNQGALVHALGPYKNPSYSINGDSWWSQGLSWYVNSSTLILPSDMAAGVFYITNTYNDIFGNAASGGWSGFALPSLSKPVKLFYGNNTMCPKNRPFRSTFRGNSAHSTGYWWQTASGIYVGGELQQNGDVLRYTSGRSASHDTCKDKLVGLPGQTAGCYDLINQVWLRFEDNKVFLANRGLQHWGERSEIIRFEMHDVGLSMNVFGKVWIDQMLMECRQNSHRPVWFNGCPAAPKDGVQPAWDTCNQRDWSYFANVAGFQWYDVGQQHIITNSTFRNCQSTWSRCVYGYCANSAVFTSLTHSDQYVPEIMQATSGIIYQNVTALWKYSTKLTDSMGNTVAGRLQGWYDADGSASRLNVRAMIGSTRANEWWKFNSGCTIESEAYKCALATGDSKGSLVLHHNATQEATIGGPICVNGNNGPNPCPLVAKATHFGRTEAVGLDIGANAKVTGPIIASQGGWYVRFLNGTPKKLEISNVQVDMNEVLLLAIPYPAGTTFTVYHKAASWCQTSWGVCQHNCRAVNSIAAVRSAFGDAYYWDNTNRVLYLRVVTTNAYFGGSGQDPAVWSPFSPPEVFSRGGQKLLVSSYQSSVVIQASCTTDPCTPQMGVAVPPPSL